MKTLNDLKKIYLDILQKYNSSFFNPADQNFYKELSGLFLTSFHPDYFISNKKIMIIGAETRGWNIYRNQQVFSHSFDMNNCIDLAIKRHQEEMTSILNSKPSNKLEFYNLIKQLFSEIENEKIIYNNLFCFSWNKDSPMKSSIYDEIKQMSKELLIAELEFYQPNFIIFANGLSSTDFRREVFPMEKCVDREDFTNEGIENKQLWKFKYEGIECYRIQHPSAISKRNEAQRARNKMIQIIKEAVN